MSRSITAPELKKSLDAKTPFTLLDLRRRADFDADTGMIPGARWLEGWRRARREVIGGRHEMGDT